MHDLIVARGRVIDPESGYNAVADVAIKDGIIVGVGESLGDASRKIDASGLVVTAGFIDLHAHGQSLPADRMQAYDGVTTSLELEVGVLPVAQWYDAHAATGRVLNYGASAGWVFARIAAMTSQTPESSLEGMGKASRDDRWVSQTASAAEIQDIVARVRQALEEGALGIGFPYGYAPGAGTKEMSQLCSLAAAFDAPTYTHIVNASNIDPKSSIESYTMLIGLAASTGAHMHICHFNSTSLMDVERAAELVAKAQAQGLNVTVEAYPYGTGSTVVGATFFADPTFPQRWGTGYDGIELLAERRRLRDRDDLLNAQRADSSALVLLHFLDVAVNPRHRALLDTSVLFSGGAIASDAMPWTLGDGSTYSGDAWPLPDDAVSHPRSAATFTKFLKEWVRERRALGLADALRKCSLIPAQILETVAPAMCRKGRVRVGFDADLVALDFDALEVRSDFSHMNRKSEGVHHLLVCGQPVICAGELILDARPGKPVRGTPAHRETR